LLPSPLDKVARRVKQSRDGSPSAEEVMDILQVWPLDSRAL